MVKGLIVPDMASHLRIASAALALLVAAMPAGAAVTALAAGYDHSCALKADGSVVCWGSDEYGESTVPTTVDGPGEATAVAAGHRSTCAIRSTGAVTCWGRNWSGVATPPDSINGTSGTATAISANYMTACAIQATSGAVICWGATR